MCLGGRIRLQAHQQDTAAQTLCSRQHRGDHFLDLLGAKQLANTFIVDAGIVRNKCQASDPAVAHSIQQTFWQATKAKAAARDKNVVFQYAVERRFCVGEEFFSHERLQMLGETECLWPRRLKA